MKLRPRTVALLCSALALVASVSVIVPLIRPKAWSLTILVRISNDDALWAPAHSTYRGFQHVGQGTYDGQFFWAIARDPLGLGSIHPLVKEPAYRYGHPLYSWLAWLLSAGGRPHAVPAALAVIGVLAFALAAAASSVLGAAAGRSPWEGLVVALNPGLILAVAFDTTEPLAAALLLAGLLAWRRDRRGLAIAAFAALCFAKEPFVTVPLALGAWEVWRRRTPLRRLLPLAASVLPVLAWWVYVRIHFGRFPFAVGADRFNTPFVGWKRAFLDAGVKTYDRSPMVIQLAQAHLVLLAAVVLLFVVAGAAALRLRTPECAPFLPLLLVVICLSPLVLEFPKDVMRAVAVPAVLIPAVIWSPRRPPTSPAPRAAARSQERQPSPT